MAEDLFDYSLLLDLNKAHVVAQDTKGLNSDEVYDLRFKCPNASYPAAKRWLQANRRILSDFDSEFKSFPDLYRTISITWEERKGESRDGGYIVHRIAKGLLTSLVSGGNVDWTEARKVSARDLEGNAESAPDSIPNTTSDDQERHITIRWPYCDPLEAQAILDSLNASTYTDVTADGEAIAGTWHRIITSYEKAEDGTCAVTMRLAEPQYTLNAYRSLETMDGSDVVYLWQVPKDLAQGIMDAWKVATPTEGRSASASYDSSGGLVNIVLTRVAGSPPNLSKAMNTACDEVTTYHFAWRYTETEMGVFLDAHNGTLGANMRRDVRVQTRSDGFFDVTITERVITFDEDEHIVDVATTSGLTIITKYFGWNVPLSELNTRKSLFEVVLEGISSTFSVRRQDDCSFDYEGSIQARNLMTKSADLGGTGIQVRVLSGEAMTQADLTSAASGFASAIRKQTSARVTVGADGLASATFSETEVQKNEAEIDSGSNGVIVEVMSGRNVDAADLTDVYESAARQQVTLDLQPQDDGSFNYTGRRVTVQKVIEAMSTSAVDGVSVSVKSGRNVDKGDLTGILVGGKRVRATASLQLQDDGTMNYTVVEQALVEFSDDWDILTDVLDDPSGIRVRTYQANNADATDLDTLIATLTATHLTSFQARITPNDDGTINYTVVSTTIQSVTFSEKIQIASTGTGIKVEAGKNKTKTEVEAAIQAYTSAGRKSHDVRVTPNDAAGFDYTVVEREVQSVAGESSSGVDGISIVALAGRNVDEADLANITESAIRKRVTLSVTPNDDGTWSYSGTEQTVQKAEAESTSGTGGVGVSVKAGRNVDAADLASLYTSAARQQVSITITPNDDGSFNYSATRQTVQASESTADSGTSGVSVETMSGKNVDVDALADIYESAARKQVSISLSSNDDGTFNYSATRQTVLASEGTADSGVNGIAVETMSGKNVDIGALSAIYESAARSQVSISLSSNDDGTFNYSATKQTVVKSEGSATSGNLGVSTEAMSGKNVDLSDLTSIYDSAARAQVSISLSSNDDGTFNYSATKQTVLKTLMASPWASTGVGINVEVTRGKNADLGDLPAVTTAVGETIQMDVAIQDDGTYDYLAIKRTTVPSTGSETIDNGGVATRVWYARNGTPANFAADMGSLGGERKNHSVSISPNDDGSLNYVITEKEVLEVVSPDVAVGPATTEGIDRRTQSGRNVSAAVLSGLATSFVAGIRKRHDISVSENDDGTFNYSITETEVRKVEVSVTSTGAGVGIDVIAGGNVAEADLASVLDVAIREQASMSMSIKDDGSIDYTILKRSVNTFEDSLETTSDPGIKTTVYHGNNLLPSEITQVIETGPRKRIDMSFRANDDGTTAYTAVVKELEDVTGLAILSGTGIEVRVKVAHNVEEDILNVFSGMTSGAGKNHSARISPNDDGTIDYTVIQTTQQRPQNTATIAAGASLGLGVSAFTGINATSAEIGSVISGLSSGARKTHQINVSPQPDGGYSYAIIERITRESETTWTAGTIGESAEIRVGSDKDDLVVSPPVVGETVQLKASFGADGTVSYTEMRGNQNEVSPAGSTSVPFGSHVLRKELTTGIFAETVKNMGYPTVGISYDVKVEVLPTGKLNYSLVKMVSNGVVAPSFGFSNRPSSSIISEGVNKTATPFKRVLQPPDPSEEYYEFNSFEVHDDLTFSGLLLDYKLDDDGPLGPFTNPVNVYFSKDRHYNQVAQPNLPPWTYYRDTQWQHAWSMFRNGSAALAYINNTSEKSSIEEWVHEGKHYWIAKRVLIQSEGAWVKL